MAPAEKATKIGSFFKMVHLNLASVPVIGIP